MNPRFSPVVPAVDLVVTSIEQMIDGTNYKTAYASGMKEEVCRLRFVFASSGLGLTHRPWAIAEHDRQRTQLPRHLLPYRIRHLSSTLSGRIDESEAKLVLAVDGDGLGFDDG